MIDDDQLADTDFGLLRELLAAAHGPDGVTDTARAAVAARAGGVIPVPIGDDLTGEARDLGGAHAALAIACARAGETALIALREAVARGAARVDGMITLVPPPPLVLLSGGATVLIGSPSGGVGSSLEYLLGLAIALDGHPRIGALAAGRGAGGAVEGAFVTPDTLARGRAAGLDAIAALTRHDAAGYFTTLGDLLPPGAAPTVAGEFRAVLIR
jgi:glycerate 2-kinase